MASSGCEMVVIDCDVQQYYDDNVVMTVGKEVESTGEEVMMMKGTVGGMVIMSA